MIYNIPKWPESSDLTHYATTWILARDVNFENVEEKVEKSEDELLAWSVDTLIPTGEIWYVKALRHLKDEDGNDVNNKKWIGPKPVFNDESNTNEYLAPKFTMAEPYISDIKYTPGEKIELFVTNIKTNVRYEGTAVYMEDLVNGDSYFKKVNLPENGYKIEFTKDEIDFSKLSILKFTVVHMASRSIISSPVVEVVDIKKVGYKVNSNTTNLDPNKENIINIKSTTFGGITVTGAKLFTRNGEFIHDLNIKDNNIIIPKLLSFDSSYIIMYDIKYKDSDGKEVLTKDSCIITTKDFEEIDTFDPNRRYVNMLTLEQTLDEKSPYLKFKNENINYNTEEFFTYIIPMIKKDTNKLAFFSYDKDKNLMSLFKELDIEVKRNFTIRLLTKSKGILQYLSDEHEVIVKLFNYDQYEDNISFYKTINTGLVGDNGAVKRFVFITAGLFIAGLDKDDKSKVVIKEIDLESGNIKNVGQYKYSKKVKDIMPVEYGDEHFLLAVKDDEEFRFLEYSTIDEIVDVGFAIPTDFRNHDLVLQSLTNNDVLGFKYNATKDQLDYFVIEFGTNKVQTFKVKNNDSKKISNFIYLKDGNGLTIVNNKEDNKKYTEFWLFK